MSMIYMREFSVIVEVAKILLLLTSLSFHVLTHTHTVRGIRVHFRHTHSHDPDPAVNAIASFWWRPGETSGRWDSFKNEVALLKHW